MKWNPDKAIGQIQAWTGIKAPAQVRFWDGFTVLEIETDMGTWCVFGKTFYAAFLVARKVLRTKRKKPQKERRKAKQDT